MPDGGFAYSHLFAKDLPPPAPLWTGFPKYNFIGGHNDPVRIPAAALAEGHGPCGPPRRPGVSTMAGGAGGEAEVRARWRYFSRTAATR